jgi:hypothetical protein
MTDSLGAVTSLTSQHGGLAPAHTDPHSHLQEVPRELMQFDPFRELTGWPGNSRWARGRRGRFR